MAKTALVLEGGSLRCLFSSAVVDVIMRNGYKFDGVFGVSAGALTGVNYVTNQIGRTARINLNFVNDWDYLGVKSLIKNRSVFNFDYLFYEISDIYIPLDREAFMSSDIEYICGVTSVNTGETKYFGRNDCDDPFDAIIASSSMPLLSNMIEINGEKFLDGGISCALPYQAALDRGYDKLVVVPTREHGFRKKTVSSTLASLYVNQYHDYPEFIKALLDTPYMYDRQANELDKLEHEGKAFVIRPEEPITISRTERDVSKLLDLYKEGTRVAEEKLSDMLKFLA